MQIRNEGEKRTRAAADIVTAVEQDILAGVRLAGERIDESALADAFNVSRTPVREAILELAAMGLVDQRAHRGAFVADVTLEEIFDVYEVLAELEALPAARKVTKVDELAAKHKNARRAAHPASAGGNVNGGACALGHPIGASGARIMVTLIHALKARGLKKGLATLCIGGGEGTALALELV